MVHGESGSWRKGGAAGAAAMALVLLGGVLASLPPVSGAAAEPSLGLKIWFDSPNHTVELPAGGPAMLDITGQFSVDRLPVERCAMTIWARLDAGWPVYVSPETAVLTSTNPQSFLVTLVVPQGAAANASVTLQAFGMYSRHSQLVEASTVIDVAPYYGVHVALGRPVQPAGPGTPPRFEAVVTNTGNAVDSFYCAGKEARIASMHRWCYSGNSSFLMDMAPGESRAVTFQAELTNPTIHPADGAWSDVFFVQSMSAQARNQTVGQDIKLALYVKWNWWDRVDVPMAAVILWAAAICAIIFSVVRTRKRQGSRRRPALKEIGKDGGP